MQFKCKGSYSKAWRVNERPEARETTHPRWPISRTVPLFLWFFQLELIMVSHLCGWCHKTFLSGDKCKTGCNTASQAFAKGKVSAAESKLPDHTAPGMLCAGTTGHWSCCFCKAVRDTKYQNVQPGAQVLTFLLSLFFCTMGFSGKLDYLQLLMSRCRDSWNPVLNWVCIQAYI